MSAAILNLEFIKVLSTAKRLKLRIADMSGYDMKKLSIEVSLDQVTIRAKYLRACHSHAQSEIKPILSLLSTVVPR